MYEWDFDPPNYRSVLDDLEREAPEALVAFYLVMDALVFDPAEYDRQPDETPGKAVRMIKFGDGRGLLTFMFHEPDRIILVIRVTWI